MKNCFKCNIVKPLNDFYKHKQMVDGHLNKCKVCAKNDVKANYSINSEDPEYIAKERERGRLKHKRLYAGIKKPTGYYKGKINDFRINYPEKYKAHSVVQRFNKTEKSNHLHHWSYNEEHRRDVVELDIAGHNFAHRHMIYDQEFYKYRKLDNTLLETKDQHIEYLKSLGIKVYES